MRSPARYVERAIRFGVVIVCALALAAAPAVAQDLPGLDGKPLSPEAKQAGLAEIACYFRAASLYDDLRSDARTIADGIESVCSSFMSASNRMELATCPVTMSASKCMDVLNDEAARQRVTTILRVRAWRATHPGKTPPWASAEAAAACPHPDAC